MRELGRITHGKHSAVDLKVVGGSTIDLSPGELDARWGRGVLGGSKVRGCGEVLVEAIGCERGVGVHETAQLKRLRRCSNIGLRELDVDLGVRGDLGVVEALALLGLGAVRIAAVVVEVGGLAVEVDRLAGSGVAASKVSCESTSTTLSADPPFLATTLVGLADTLATKVVVRLES